MVGAGGGRWSVSNVGGRCFAFLLVGGRFIFLRIVGGRCLNKYMVGGRWLMVGVVCGLWSVAGRWAVVLYYAHSCTKMCSKTQEVHRLSACWTSYQYLA